MSMIDDINTMPKVHDWWSDWNGSEGYDEMFHSWRTYTQDEKDAWGETPYTDEEMIQAFERTLKSKGYSPKKLKEVSVALTKEKSKRARAYWKQELEKAKAGGDIL